MKRVLVAGGAGFIGAALCRRLIATNHHVICVDNLSTGRQDNLTGLIQHDNFEFIEHDIIAPLNVACDAIANLACPASPRYYLDHPIQTTKTSMFGALNLLELAHRNEAPILQASTSEIYGNPDIQPQTEAYFGNVNSVGTRACYNEGKRVAESLFFDFYREHSLPIKIARIFNTYGPGMQHDDGRVVSNFIMQALQGQPLSIYGDGSQTRSFCYIDDLLDGLIRLWESGPQVTGPINLGNPEEYTVLELAEKVIDLVGSASTIDYHDAMSDDPQRRRPDIAKAHAELDWQPSTALDTGLMKTISFYREHLAATKPAFDQQPALT
jgi:UDP-glucuronate decarboxylase